jgi:hypothetical protein
MLRTKSSRLSFYGSHIYDWVTPAITSPSSWIKWSISPVPLWHYDIPDRRVEEEVNVDSTHAKAKVNTFKIKGNPSVSPDNDGVS